MARFASEERLYVSLCQFSAKWRLDVLVPSRSPARDADDDDWSDTELGRGVVRY